MRGVVGTGLAGSSPMASLRENAFEQIRRLRHAIRMIFMSGCTADVICGKGVLDEGLDFVEKPIVRLGFLKKVREVLDREPA
jgi:hypothetical protein